MIIKCSIILLILESISCGSHKGKSFPKKYLEAEEVVPEYSDATYYLRSLDKTLGFLATIANNTDINRALGLFYMKAILKRTIIENKNKIQEEEHKLMRSAILYADDILSHFFSYNIKPLSWGDILKRASYLLTEDDLQVEAIGEFKKNQLKKWILSDISLNDYEQDMDELKLSKETYLNYTEEVMQSTVFIINLDDSDYCLGQVIYNPTPLEDTKTLRLCVYDQFCPKILYHRGPSVSYSTSHRMLNIMMARHVRRCYIQDADDDEELMEALCSSMYREAVYLARRGYFNRDVWMEHSKEHHFIKGLMDAFCSFMYREAVHLARRGYFKRDVWMEHIALCGMLGYEEFFRRHWFRKVVSWVDDQGCLAENFNYEVNRTRYFLKKSPENEKSILEMSRKVLADPCSFHPMALSLVVLAHGVRHAIHFSKPDVIKDEL